MTRRWSAWAGGTTASRIRLGFGTLALLLVLLSAALIARGSLLQGSTQLLVLVGVVAAFLTAFLLGRGIVKGEQRLWASREHWRVTLASIGDAVITTDTQGRVNYLNAVAERLTGWNGAEASGQALETVFRIINESSRAPVANPASRALQHGMVVGLANHTILVAKDGTETPIDDSAAPIRDEQGAISGVVLIFRDVTERRRVEASLSRARDELEQRVEQRTAELARANAFMHTLLENLQEGIVACDADGVLTLFNKATRDFHGLPKEPIPAEQWADHYNLYMADGSTPMRTEDVPLFRALHGEDVRAAEMVIAPKDGQRRSLLAYATALHDADGAVQGAVVSMHDITRRRHAEAALQQAHDELESRVAERTAELSRINDELRREAEVRKHAEAALRETETRWGGIFEQLHEGFIVGEIVYDASGNPVDWRYLELNGAWEEMTGLSRDSVQGSLLSEVIPGAEPEWVQDFAEVVRTGKPATFLRQVAALGRWYEVHVFRPEPGRFGALFFDVSERKRAESVRIESEQRLRFVMDSMPQKIFTAKADGSVDYFNPQWMEYTGLSFEQIRDWGWRQFVHADDVDENIRVWQHSLATGEPFQFEHRFRDASGAYRWHISRALPLQDGEGNTLMWVGSNTDIDEQRKSADALSALAAALSEADRQKTEFLAMLAHELRNPLAPMSNAVQILQLTGGEPDAVKSVTGIMDRQVRQMVRLVDDLLDISRISRGKIGLRCERMDLVSVINQAVEAARPAIQRGEHELTFESPPNPVWLHADPQRLVQIFGNLLNNAAKFSEPGGRISIVVEPSDGEVVTRVRDTGIGIPADKLEAIFDMFTQADQSLERSYGGLGIGLTLVRQLVDMHGGSVSVSSAGPGSGSEFVVRLPASTPAETHDNPL